MKSSYKVNKKNLILRSHQIKKQETQKEVKKICQNGLKELHLHI